MPISLGEEIANQGWRTGSVISHDMVPRITDNLTHAGGPHALVGDDDWLVVASQTCDLVAKTLDQEPFVEVLHCRPIRKLRSQHKDLRSTRVLDFKPNREEHPQILLSAHAARDHFYIPRELLRLSPPDAARRLDAISTRRLLVWFALRYSRPAWPDEFVRRIGDKKRDLEASVELLKDDIAEVRISIVEKDEELPEGVGYHVAIFFVVDERIWDAEPDCREHVNAAYAKFIGVLGRCGGVEIDTDNSGVFSGGEFTWQVTRLSDEWNYANLSHYD